MIAKDLLEAAHGLEDRVTAERRRLHRLPEVGLELPETQALILEALDELGIPATTGSSCSSVVATLHGDRDGPAILLRADMDALPMPEKADVPFRSSVDGLMHACGHDAHVAMLLGAARLLQSRRGELEGHVLLMFQPGEEEFLGAKQMIEDGLLEGALKPAAAFAIHQTPSVPSGMIASRVGPVTASADQLRIEVRARGGHASMPHLVCDPIPIACEIVTAIQSMMTRRVDPFNPAIVTVATIAAGTTDNVIPDNATMFGTIRAMSEPTRDQVIRDLHRLADGIAAAHGATAAVTIQRGCPVMVNGDAVTDFAVSTARELLGAARVMTLPNPVMASEDFAYVLDQVPGSMAFLGTSPGGDNPPSNHSSSMVIDERAMPVGVALHAAMALAYCRSARDAHRGSSVTMNP